MRGPRTEHGCVMCGCHWENEVYRDETGGTDHAYALRCLLKPKTYTTNGHEPQVSGVPICTLPLDLTAAEISRDAVEEGHGDDLQIVLPGPFIQQLYLHYLVHSSSIRDWQPDHAEV